MSSKLSIKATDVTSLRERKKAPLTSFQPRNASLYRKLPVQKQLLAETANKLRKGVEPFISEELIILSIKSLMADRIRPLLPDLQQRLKYFLKKNVETAHAKNIKLDVSLLSLFIRMKCAATVELVLHKAAEIHHANNIRWPTSRSSEKPEANCNFLEAKLVQQPEGFEGFADPHSNVNPFTELVWNSFHSFLLGRLSCTAIRRDQPGLAAYQFKGGRYGLAVELQRSEYPSLAELKLGDLCHLVQLAIDGGALAYEKSCLQPIAACKELCTSRGIKDASADQTMKDNRSGTFQSIAELAKCLDIILKDKPTGVVLAQLRQKLRIRFKLELVPELLGYRKLIDCLMCTTIQSFAVITSMHEGSHRLAILHRDFSETCTNLLVSPARSQDGGEAITMERPSSFHPSSPGTASTIAGTTSSEDSMSVRMSPESFRVLPPSTQLVDSQLPFVMRPPLVSVGSVAFSAQQARSLQPTVFSRMDLDLSRHQDDSSDDDMPFIVMRKVINDIHRQQHTLDQYTHQPCYSNEIYPNYFLCA